MSRLNSPDTSQQRDTELFSGDVSAHPVAPSALCMVVYSAVHGFVLWLVSGLWSWIVPEISFCFMILQVHCGAAAISDWHHPVITSILLVFVNQGIGWMLYLSQCIILKIIRVQAPDISDQYGFSALSNSSRAGGWFPQGGHTGQWRPAGGIGQRGGIPFSMGVQPSCLSSKCPPLPF